MIRGGRVVSPGFIDVHSHSEEGREGQDAIGNPAAEINIRQGVTTLFASPDSGGSVRVGECLAMVAAARPTGNAGSFIGHGSVRGTEVPTRGRSIGSGALHSTMPAPPSPKRRRRRLEPARERHCACCRTRT
ncbi:MAG: hypothetical protein ABL982_18035 [Vicinamibacterales bacterium]